MTHERSRTLNARDLVLLKLELEFGVLPDGESLPLAAIHADGQPRVLASRHRDGTLLLFRDDVPPRTRDALRELGIAVVLRDEASVAAILSRDEPVRDIWRVRWYTVERDVAPDEYPDVVRHEGRYAILAHGRPVATAWDTQSSPRAVEVEVTTDEEFRRRGYARQVVAAWMSATRQRGLIGYYSHLRENVASEALARSLGLTWLADEVEYR